MVCLMQVSTRERDFIVDPLTLRADIGKLLPIFTDPGIIKVVHSTIMETVLHISGPVIGVK